MYGMAKILLLFLIGAGPCYAQAALDWLPFAEAMQTSHQQPTMVYVQAPWCGPCRQLERSTFSDAMVQEALGGWALAKLTIDDHDRTHRVGPYVKSEADWADKLGATTTPTLIFLRSDGGILARRTGVLPPEALIDMLAAVTTEAQHNLRQGGAR